MIQLQEYSIAWLIYLVASLGLVVLAWRLFRIISWRYLRRVLVLTALVVFLTPAIGDNQYWAPAWIIASLQLLFEGVEGAEPAARILLLVWLFCFCVYSIISLWFLLTGKRSPETTQPKTAKAKTPARTPKGDRNNRIPPRIS